MDGLSLLREVRSRGGQSVFVVATAKRLAHIARDALNTGADYYLQKGADMADEVPRLIDFLRTRIPQKNAEVRAGQLGPVLQLVSLTTAPNSSAGSGRGGELTFVNEPFVHLFKKNRTASSSRRTFSLRAGLQEREEILGCLRALSPELAGLPAPAPYPCRRGAGSDPRMELPRVLLGREGETQEYQLGGRR